MSTRSFGHEIAGGWTVESKTPTSDVVSDVDKIFVTHHYHVTSTENPDNRTNNWE